MSFYEQIFLNIIIILFPIFIYFIYVAYNNNINKEKNKLCFDFMNITILYLLIKYKPYFSELIFIIIVNIPLLLLFFKKRTIISLIISFIIAFSYNYFYNFNILLVLLEYFLYFSLYYFVYNKKNNFDLLFYLFIFLKGIVISLEILYLIANDLSFSILIIRVFIMILLFYLITTVIFYLLKKGEELLSLNKVLKELEKEKALRNSLFKITHEIKNPLAVCKGYLDMIDLTNISKASKYHNIIKNEIERTLSLMDDFLDYTKIKVVKEEMDVSMLLEDVIKTLKPLLLNSKITLKESIEEEVYLNGDYNRLKQVLINLIKNSIEAINNDKGIILLNLKETKSFVNITIIDNGCGMNKETLEKIKETFFTTKQKGTGLGVTLSNEIIKLHNGSLKYTSKINKGTKVTINLHK